MYAQFFYSSKTNLAPEQENQIKTPATIFFTHFQISATMSDWKQGTETAAALPPSRECTKEPISALPNIGSMKSFELEQKDKISVTKKTEVEVLPGTYLILQLAK